MVQELTLRELHEKLIKESEVRLSRRNSLVAKSVGSTNEKESIPAGLTTLREIHAYLMGIDSARTTEDKNYVLDYQI